MRRRNLAVGIAAVLLAGCTSGAGPDTPARPTSTAWTPEACPPEVETQVVPEHTCGWITAPLGQGEQELFVVVVEPPDPSDRAPILETGTDLGVAPNYAALAPIAQRTGRRTVLLDMPGTGRSVPSLGCDEAEELGDTAVDAPALLEAIESCRQRLANEGVDPSLMSPRKAAPALLAVMDALGSEQWVLMGHGTTAAAAVHVAGEHPTRVEALVLDSPVQTKDGWAARRADIVAAVAAACTAGPGCTERHRDVEDLWRRAWRRAGRAPIDLSGRALDRPLLDRAVRWIGAPATGATGLPALLQEAASGRKNLLLYELEGLLPSAPPLCVGLLPKCHGRDQDVALGAVLASICPDGSGGPAFAAACRRWGAAESPEAEQSVDGVPTLVLLGELDPFASPEAARASVLRQVPEAHVVVVPGLGHNVLGEECPRTIRNDWLAGSADAAPDEPDCLAIGLQLS